MQEQVRVRAGDDRRRQPRSLARAARPGRPRWQARQRCSGTSPSASHRSPTTTSMTCCSRSSAYRLLTGYRGAPALDVDALRQVLRRVSALAEDLPEIAEMDLNPCVRPREGCRGGRRARSLHGRPVAGTLQRGRPLARPVAGAASEANADELARARTRGTDLQGAARRRSQPVTWHTDHLRVQHGQRHPHVPLARRRRGTGLERRRSGCRVAGYEAKTPAALHARCGAPTVR